MTPSTTHQSPLGDAVQEHFLPAVKVGPYLPPHFHPDSDPSQQHEGKVEEEARNAGQP